VPTILAARSLGIATAIHEGNVVAGLANRMLSWFVDRVYLGFAEAIKEFQTGKVLVTGNPVRPDVAALANQLHNAPSPGQPYRILVTGGSEGSFFLNRQVPKLLARLASAGLTLEVLHQSGLADQDGVREAYREASLKSSVTPFVEDMAKAYQWADFAITCSGAATLAEAAIVGLPLLPVPLSTAAKNHQVFNAIAFARITGAFWLSENGWKFEEPDKKIAALLSHQMAWREASENVRRFARPEANRTLVTDSEAMVKARRSERICRERVDFLSNL
jgi:UDP-N-acetylglucosamine--N-acetylmuramyl-(pentapeptide) pyrophosphoryl-undecaprenol N-acetylglucosamine transferase